MVKPGGAQPTVRRTKGQKANRKRMATVAAVFTRAPWVRTPEQVVESLFRIPRQTPADGQTPPRPENKRVWASLLKGKTAVIEEVAQEMQRRDPQGIKTRVALTDGERALQIPFEGTLGGTLILDLFHVLEKLWKAAHVFHAEGTVPIPRFCTRSRSAGTPAHGRTIGTAIAGARWPVPRSGRFQA